MATTFKTFQNNDIASTRTLLHEAVPITGTLVSGTYDSSGTPLNVKTYSHAMFESVYDYPYLSSSANHILDITAGFHSGSYGQRYLSKSVPSDEGTSLDAQRKKIATYNEMAQLLVGYDSFGNIRPFDQDGNFVKTTGDKMNACFFINFSRLLTKDEIKKGSFSMSFQTGGLNDAPAQGVLTLGDTNGATQYFTNSPAGEYAILSCSSIHAAERGHRVGDALGLIYYQAGIAVITSSLFLATHHADGTPYKNMDAGTAAAVLGKVRAFSKFGPRASAGTFRNFSVRETFVTSSQEVIADALRNRIHNIEFNNTTELNSTIYFCRANHSDFNYSSNPTYTTGSKIRVKESTLDNPVSYITTIGLYSPDNELMAVAKLSEPIKKDPTNELTFRVRLDY